MSPAVLQKRNAPRKNHSPVRPGRLLRTSASTLNVSVVGESAAASAVRPSSTSTEVTVHWQTLEPEDPGALPHLGESCAFENVYSRVLSTPLNDLLMPTRFNPGPSPYLDLRAEGSQIYLPRTSPDPDDPSAPEIATWA